MTVCGLLSIVAVQAQPLLKTHVETGDVEGILEGNDLAVYKAIPYAAPPVGASYEINDFVFDARYNFGVSKAAKGGDGSFNALTFTVGYKF